MFQPVLNYSFTQSIPLIDFFAIEILIKKQIPDILNILPPLSLLHLKRIKGNLILFTDNLLQIDQELKNNVLKFSNKNDFVTVKVIFFFIKFIKIYLI